MVLWPRFKELVSSRLSSFIYLDIWCWIFLITFPQWLVPTLLRLVDQLIMAMLFTSSIQGGSLPTSSPSSQSRQLNWNTHLPWLCFPGGECGSTLNPRKWFYSLCFKVAGRERVALLFCIILESTSWSESQLSCLSALWLEAPILTSLSCSFLMWELRTIATNIYWLLTKCQAPVQNSLLIVIHLFLIMIPWTRQDYWPHFTDKKTESHSWGMTEASFKRNGLAPLFMPLATQ